MGEERLIIIDSREQFKNEIKTKLQSLHINAQIMKLEHFTDYVLTSDNKEVQNVVAVQRKTIGEVLSQFKDIQTRLPELQKYGVPWLLVEEENMFIDSNGMILSKRGKRLYETGIKAQSYYNFLHSVERGGTTVKVTSNWEQSIWWLYSLHQYIQKEHLPKLNRKYTQKEEVIGVLLSIPSIGLEKAQEIYGLYELLYAPISTIVDADASTQNPLMLNLLDENPLMLKVFDKLLRRAKSVLREQKLSKNVLTKQLKTRVIKEEALLNAFISFLVDANYFQKERKGKYVYYSLKHKKPTRKDSKKQDDIDKEEDDDDKWLEEADKLVKEMDTEQIQKVEGWNENE